MSANPVNAKGLDPATEAVSEQGAGPARASWKAKLAVGLSVMVMALVFCELGLRLFWTNPFRDELPDHMVKIRTSHPNSDASLNRGPVNPKDPWTKLRTDSRGYVLPSVQHEKPDATIAFLGGSTTLCAAVKEDLRFPALVSSLLAKQNLKVNTLNAAYSGNTVHDALDILLNRIAQDRPDWAVMMHAANDIGVLAKQGDYRSRMGKSVSVGDVGKWLMQMASSHLYLAGRIRNYTLSVSTPKDPSYLAWRNDPAHADLPLDQYRQRLRAFVHLCRDFGIEPVLMTQPMSGARNELSPEWADLGAQDRCNAMIRSVGTEENVLVIDLIEYLHAEVPDWDKGDTVFYDGVHVNDNGSQVYATCIAERLRPLILNHLRMRGASEPPVH